MSDTSSEIRGPRLVNYQMLERDIWKKMTRNAVVTTRENVTSAQLGLLAGEPRLTVLTSARLMPATNVARFHESNRSRMNSGTVNRSTCFASERRKVQFRLKIFQARVETGRFAISSTTELALHNR
jgi:hypothetical protein